jgi:NitT/TauT family transport system ATP-binding protein
MQPDPCVAPVLQIEHVSKEFAAANQPVRALQDVSFCVDEGEIVSLLGPSGSGKSTLLRIAGGLLPPDGGSVYFQGQPLRQPHIEIGFVFQTTNLMPWRSVIQNVLLPLEVQQGRVGEEERRQARRLLGMVGLDGFEDAYPRQLSGGMAQRVVLARTLIHHPRLLLMDEPFGALDAMTRERMNLELLRIHEMQTTSILLVTHSIVEAVFLADRVIVLSRRPGRVAARLPVPLPRPRTIPMMASEPFGRLTLEVRQYLDDGSGDDVTRLKIGS